MSNPPVIRAYVDTVLVAPARLRDTRQVKALAEEHAGSVHHQRDRIRKGVLRRRPGVRVGRRTYRAPLHVHQPDDFALNFIRSALKHGRLAVLRLDIALDIRCDNRDAADALHAELRRKITLSGARGPVRVSHGGSIQMGTTYLGVGKGQEGAVLVVYSDEHAACKNGGTPTTHIELRLFGARAVRAAVGRSLTLEMCMRRVRVVSELRVPTRILRAAQNAGPTPYAQDVVEVMRRHGIDRRSVVRRAIPICDWARRNVAPAPASGPTASDRPN
ncbi:MAG: hypothetical protein JNM10_13350 [Planctomycetia bacterium]|nr:hypothetical protein [Planctomycetia bacterium]